MVSRRTDDRGGLVPAPRSVPVMAEPSEIREWAKQLVARALEVDLSRHCQSVELRTSDPSARSTWLLR